MTHILVKTSYVFGSRDEDLKLEGFFAMPEEQFRRDCQALQEACAKKGADGFVLADFSSYVEGMQTVLINEDQFNLLSLLFHGDTNQVVFGTTWTPADILKLFYAEEAAE